MNEQNQSDLKTKSFITILFCFVPLIMMCMLVFIPCSLDLLSIGCLRCSHFSNFNCDKSII